VAYRRALGDEALVMALNAGPAGDFDIPVGGHPRLAEGAMLVNRIGPSRACQVRDGRIRLHIGRREGLVLSAA
jgi:hypothetical protein